METDDMAVASAPGYEAQLEVQPLSAPTRLVIRKALARHLIGNGLELGPGHNPFPVPYPGTVIRYVDRWQPAENRELFPELESPEFPEPDFVANFDIDGLAPIPDGSQDFVIASHVLEHLADPIGFLVEIHRVLRPGGIALILLPDRERTFDRFRNPTSIAHLVSEHRAAVRSISDEHIEDYLLSLFHIATPDQVREIQGALDSPPDERKKHYDLHRRRSFHVHCWSQEEFNTVIEYTIEQLGLRWEFVEGVLTEEGGSQSIEFGYVLRRSIVNLDPVRFSNRFQESYEAWREARRRLLVDARTVNVHVDPFIHQIDQLHEEVKGLQRRLDDSLGEIRAIYSTRTFRYMAPLRRVYADLSRRRRRNS